MNTTSLKSKVALILVAFFAIPMLALAQTWTAPLGAPPGNNTPAPVNVGGSAQAKTGDLTLQSDVTFNGASDPASVLSSWITSGFFGNVVIGNPLAGSNVGPYPTLNINGKFRFIPRTIGSPAAPIGNNWVLTTDSLGYAKWTDPATIPSIGGQIGVSVNGDPVTTNLHSINFIGSGIFAPVAPTGDVQLTVNSGGGTSGSLPAGTAVGQTLYWNGTAWAIANNVKTNAAANQYFLVDGGVGDFKVDNGGIAYTDFLGVNQITNLSGSISIGDGAGVPDTIRILPQGSVPAAGKILTSVDATGKVSWQTPGVGSSAGTPVVVNDEGDLLTSGVTSINFTGPGVTATATGNNVTVNVTGGGGSGSLPPGENVDHILAWDEDSSQWISAGLEFVIPGTANQTLRYNGATNDWVASSAILNDEPNHKLYVGNESNTDLVYVSGDEVDLFAPSIKVHGSGLDTGVGRFLYSTDANGKVKWNKSFVYDESLPSSKTFKILNNSTPAITTFASYGLNYLSQGLTSDGDIVIDNDAGLFINDVPYPADADGIVKLCVDTNGENNTAGDTDDNRVVQCRALPGSFVIDNNVVSSTDPNGDGIIDVATVQSYPETSSTGAVTVYSFLVPPDVNKINVKLLGAGGGGGGGGAGYKTGSTIDSYGGAGGGGGGEGGMTFYTDANAINVVPGSTIYLYVGHGGTGGAGGGHVGSKTTDPALNGKKGGPTFISATLGNPASTPAISGTSKLLGGDGGIHGGFRTVSGEFGPVIIGGGVSVSATFGGDGGNGGVGVDYVGTDGGVGQYGWADHTDEDGNGFPPSGGSGGGAAGLFGGEGGTGLWIQNDLNVDGSPAGDPTSKRLGAGGLKGENADTLGDVPGGGGSGGGGAEPFYNGNYNFPGVGFFSANLSSIPSGFPASYTGFYCKASGGATNNCGGNGGKGGDGAIKISW